MTESAMLDCFFTDNVPFIMLCWAKSFIPRSKCCSHLTWLYAQTSPEGRRASQRTCHRVISTRPPNQMPTMQEIVSKTRIATELECG
jgi:hypothetical protein